MTPYKAYKTNDIVNHTMMRVALWAVDMNVNRIQLEYEEVWIKSQITPSDEKDTPFHWELTKIGISSPSKLVIYHQR